jgi:polyhydroxybutyrate depolymerase
MKRCLSLFLIGLLVLSLYGGTAETIAGTVALVPSEKVLNVSVDDLGYAKNYDFQHEEKKRSYILYIPPEMRDDRPLVFLLHGYYGFASSFMNETNFNKTAKLHGFAVVYPQGTITDTSGFASTHWNADFDFSNVEDAGFLTTLALYLQKTYGFSQENTFMAGISNGGFMSYAVATNKPGTFAALASVAGTMSRKTWNRRELAKAIPIMQIHGTIDTVVPIDGTMTTEGGWGGAPPMQDIIKFWAQKNQARREETTHDGRITRQLFYDQQDHMVVNYSLIDGFGHLWPTLNNSTFDTNEEIWHFFSSVIANRR